MEQNLPYNGQKDLLTDVFETPVDFAGFWLRFAAYVIDAAVLYLVLLIVTLMSGQGFYGAQSPENFSSTMIVVLVVFYIGAILYFPLMESSSWQATLGKRAVNIKVTDMYGNRIGFGNAIGRLFAKIVSAIILYIGFIMAGFTEKKQGLHDMMAGTLVVKGRGSV